MWPRIWNFLDRWFFGPASVGTSFTARLVRLLRYPYAVVRDLMRGEINLRAMVLVYTTLLTLIPLVAFSFAILKVFGAHRALQPIVYEFFRPLGPDGAAELTSRVMQFADGVSSGIVGSVGFVLLLWTLLSTIKNVEDSFNYLWRVEQPRSFARRAAEYLSLLLVGPILLVAFISLSHTALASEPVRWVTELPLMDQLTNFGINLAPYVIVTLFFTALYMYLPNTRVHIRSAVIGALVAGVLWAAVGRTFTAFVMYSTRLTLVYAGFAVIVAAILWTYLGWLILLAGAQLSFYIQNPSYLRLGLQELRLSGAEIEQLALKVMYFVGRAHLNGEKRWTVNALARELGLPGLAVADVAGALERSGLLIHTENEELAPGRDISRISVHEILEVARSQRHGQFAPRAAHVPPVDRLTVLLDQAWRDCCSTRSLRDLVEEPA